MAVLFSELLLPGWAEGTMIGLADVTGEVELPCHSSDPELFFSDEIATQRVAKSLCAACPMKSACLAGALSRAEPCGIWGGELFVDGRAVEVKRTVGRPPIVRIRTHDEPASISAHRSQEARVDQSNLMRLAAG